MTVVPKPEELLILEGAFFSLLLCLGFIYGLVKTVTTAAQLLKRND